MSLQSVLNWIEKHKRKLVLALCALLVLSSVLSSRQSGSSAAGSALGFIVTPLQRAVTNIAAFVGDWAASAADQRDLAAENAALQERIAELEAENERLQLYAEENANLSALLQISRKYADYETLGVRVTAKDPGNWYDTFLLDKGANDGLDGKNALLTSEGLVGRITESGATYSRAITILDPNSSVSALCQRTGDLGVVKGDYTLMRDGLCLMEYIDSEAAIIEGDEIVTSYLSDIYPAGIPIGVVKEIRTDENGLTKYAVIAPYVDLKHLESMLAVLGEAGEAP